jgi:hypothetical protein
MTKKELYDELSNCETEYGINSKDVVNLLYKFFESNICTPKGENRHPYADELHAYIEGIQIQQQFIGNDTWYDIATAISHFDVKYRIKPQELVYEWQYVIIYNGIATITEEFFTEQEFWYTHSSSDFIDTAYAIEKTSRIRK